MPDNHNPNIENINDSIVIVQRHFDILINLHKINPLNRYILWSHDHITNNNANLFGEYSSQIVNQYFHQYNIPIISVSNFHKNTIEYLMPNIKVFTIYNGLFTQYYKKNENIKYDKNSIIFASAWHKGIDNILKIGSKYYLNNKKF